MPFQIPRRLLLEHLLPLLFLFGAPKFDAIFPCPLLLPATSLGLTLLIQIHQFHNKKLR